MSFRREALSPYIQNSASKFDVKGEIVIYNVRFPFKTYPTMG